MLSMPTHNGRLPSLFALLNLVVLILFGHASTACGAADPSTVQRSPPGDTNAYRSTQDQLQSPEQLSEYLIVAMAVVFAVPVYCLLIQRLYPHRFAKKDNKPPRFTKADIEQCCAAQFVTTCPICVVCMDDVQSEEPARQLSCGHTYHADCIDSWWTHIDRTNLECPTCRKTQLGPEDKKSPPVQAAVPAPQTSIAVAHIQALYAGVLTSLQARRTGSPRREVRATLDLDRNIIEVDFSVDPDVELGEGRPSAHQVPDSFAVTLHHEEDEDEMEEVLELDGARSPQTEPAIPSESAARKVEFHQKSPRGPDEGAIWDVDQEECVVMASVSTLCPASCSSQSSMSMTQSL